MSVLHDQHHGSRAMKDRGDVVFITAALVLVAGVPVALYAVYYFAESVQLLATAVLIMLLLVAIMGLIVVRNWDRIVATVLKKPVEFSQDVSEPCRNRFHSTLKVKLTKPKAS
jgi:membrane protein YdbS with pleckstrin-like domain